MADERFLFYRAIADGLAAHPDWLRDALDAIAAGMDDALASANERAAKKDIAFMCALSLADPARLSPENKAALNRTIVAAIDPTVASEAERRALGRAQEQPNG